MTESHENTPHIEKIEESQKNESWRKRGQVPLIQQSDEYFKRNPTRLSVLWPDVLLSLESFNNQEEVEVRIPGSGILYDAAVLDEISAMLDEYGVKDKAVVMCVDEGNNGVNVKKKGVTDHEGCGAAALATPIGESVTDNATRFSQKTAQRYRMPYAGTITSSEMSRSGYHNATGVVITKDQMNGHDYDRENEVLAGVLPQSFMVSAWVLKDKRQVIEDVKLCIGIAKGTHGVQTDQNKFSSESPLYLFVVSETLAFLEEDIKVGEEIASLFPDGSVKAVGLVSPKAA